MSDDDRDLGAAVREEIPTALDGERLDRVVALIGAISRSDAAALIASGGVSVDGAPATAGKVRLREGQVLEVDLSLVPTPTLPAADPLVVVPVVHEDDDLLVIDKPPGLVVHPAPGHETGTLVNGLLARYSEIAQVGDPSRPGIVHRLDVGTSGLMVVARTPAAYDTLVADLAARRITREYVALVWGVPAAVSGIIDAPIGRDPRDPLRMAVVVDGRPARTHYTVAREYADPVVALVDCRLETGRTHQIRVHLAAIGHPVVGDGAYGGGRPGLRAPRPVLHASHLVLRHPRTGERLDLHAPLPADLQAILDQCRAAET